MVPLNECFQNKIDQKFNNGCHHVDSPGITSQFLHQDWLIVGVMKGCVWELRK